MHPDETVASAIEHGTITGYTGYCCRCPECRSAWAGYYRDRRHYLRQYGALTPGWRSRLQQEMGASNG